MQLLIFLSLVASSLALLGIGSQQSVAVTGKLNCDGKPAVGVKVKLYEKESLIDVKMDEGKTNKDGEFHLSGHKTEISKIDPKVNIYHKCNHKGVSLVDRPHSTAFICLICKITAVLPKVRHHHPG
ncbi:Transthyretin-like family protein [Ancylostoma caninum]|uniref:Transthyretin-like family protein n=1 Tax=Ancylostoma caninum TaxID=29170 RepID=A0A368FWF3_ANCCA|nr:Transthyretin-like family protein [Ancylostoma caninum]